MAAERAGWTYTGDIRVPVVERHEVLRQRSQDRDLLLSIVVHDLLGQKRRVRLTPIATNLLLNKPLHLRRLTRVRLKAAKELEVVAIDRMIRVVDDRVIVGRLTARLAELRVRDVERVAEGTVVDGVVEALDGLAAEEVVEGAVLHDQDDEVLDFGFEVGDGFGVAGSWHAAHGGGREGQESEGCGGTHGILCVGTIVCRP